MEYIIYFIFAMIAFFLFVPKTGTTQIRNLPLLIAVLVIIAGFLLWQLLRRVVFMQKVKKALKNKGCEIIKTRFNPFASGFNGRYSVLCRSNGEFVSFALMLRKRKYQHYHFESVDNLELYRSTRVAVGGTRAPNVRVSSAVETKMVGKQKLAWGDADRNIVVFDKLPDHITDSKQKNPLSKGDKICGTEIYIADIESFSEILNEIL